MVVSGIYKVVVVVENDNLKFFVDGVLVGSDINVMLLTGLNEIYLSGYFDIDVRYGIKKFYLYFLIVLIDVECIVIMSF